MKEKRESAVYILHQVARSGDFAKEAAHYHNTDRAFDLPLLSENFKGMEIKIYARRILIHPHGSPFVLSTKSVKGTRMYITCKIQ